MGGKASLFNACKGKLRHSSDSPPDSPLYIAESSGPAGDIIENPSSGYTYFSLEEEKQYELKLMQELKRDEITPPKNWQTSEILGHGSFGRVLFAANMDTGELMAIKQIPLPGPYETKKNIDEIEQEIEILSQLEHKNIVRYLGTSRDSQHLNIFLEYVAGGSISSLLNKFGKFNEPLIRVYTKQILEGLEYLHYHKIIHRDIKGANVLVNNEGIVKLADFGASKRIYGLSNEKTQFHSLRGTINWMAPEVIKQEGHGRYADIWSLGCTVLEMATAKPPWYNKPNPISVIMHVGTTDEPPEIPKELSEHAKDFILKCFIRNPSSRPNVCKLLKHPFIQGIAPIIMPLSSSTPMPNLNEEIFASNSTKYSSESYKNMLEFESLGLHTIREEEVKSIEQELKRESDIDEKVLEFMDPAHNLKAPFHNIITTSQNKLVVPVRLTSDAEIVLRRPPTMTDNEDEENSIPEFSFDTVEQSPQIILHIKGKKSATFFPSVNNVK